jgi:hypothetical protein
LQRGQRGPEFLCVILDESMNLLLGLEPYAAAHGQHGADLVQHLHNLRMALRVRRTGDGGCGEGGHQATIRDQAKRFRLREGGKSLLNILCRAENSMQDILHPDVSTIEGQKL